MTLIDSIQVPTTTTEASVIETMKCLLNILPALLFLTSIPLEAYSKNKITIGNPTLQIVSECINNAIDIGVVQKDDDGIFFGCKDAVAEKFYNYMGSLDIPAEIEKDRQGRRLTRYLDAEKRSFCYHEIEQADGTSNSFYGCALTLRLGSFLNR